MNKGAARVLHFALPIRAGDRVAVLGPAPAVLLQSLRQAAADVVEVSSAAEPEQPADHAIVTAMSLKTTEEMCRWLAHSVRPEGNILIGIPNAGHLSGAKDRGWTAKQGRDILGRYGFANPEIYGVPNNLSAPQPMIPLEHSGAVRWYVTSAYQPNSLRGAIFVRIVERLPPPCLSAFLFRSLIFVARQRAAPAGGTC